MSLRDEVGMLVRFAGQSRPEVYGCTVRTPVRFQYAGLGKRDKGLVRSYVARMTGLSRAQVRSMPKPSISSIADI